MTLYARGLSLVSNSSNGSRDITTITTFCPREDYFIHPTIMSDLEPSNGVGLARANTSMETGSATPMVRVEESHSSSEMISSRIPAAQPEDKSKEKVCGVCNDHEARYKCSRCQLP
jgi:hypothetical protein